METIRIGSGAVLCICLLPLHDSRNPKPPSHFLPKSLYKQLWTSIRNLLPRPPRSPRFTSPIRHLVETKTPSRFYKRSQHARAWETGGDTHSNRAWVGLDISKFSYIETASQHQVSSTAMQSCKSLRRCWRYTVNSGIHLLGRLATLLHRDDFAITRKSANQEVRITYIAKTSNPRSFQ